MTTSIETNITLMHLAHFTYDEIAHKLRTQSYISSTHCDSDNWEKLPDFIAILDEMKHRKHDSINSIPQRKNWRGIVTSILGLIGVLKRVGKCVGEKKKRRRLRAGATPIHKQAIDENLPIQPPSIDKRSQAEASMASRPNLRQIIK
jgi:hypothetical protein